ncbi:hypothetical protein FA95DRAFT_1494222 [Auriscalpium vulgare]|uniref:Uncharacterized protein n=1 Tax=Auriscalpium vulgare TaxID=40419 RepID=A0ACB8RR03_9AGAM|nr:hypothetical protein FA95DRAFT_1494222 [Auriscalpium vulgare]
MSLHDAFAALTVQDGSSLVSKILSNADIHDAVFGYCTPGTLFRLARTCKTACVSVKSFIARAYNINKHISRYFADALGFRALQARTSTLISGSSALQFLDRTYYPGSDLDIYTPLYRVRDVADWLRAAGYVYRPNSFQSASFDATLLRLQTRQIQLEVNHYSRMRGVAGVFNFWKPAPDGSPEEMLKVQIMAATRSPAEAILNYHSTCVMNVISYSTAYSLYPRATFEAREALICRPHQDAPIEKYARRGWTMHPARPDERTDPAFKPGSRWIDDACSWVLPLAPALDAAPDPVAVTNWQFDYRIGASTEYRAQPEMRYKLVCSEFLEYVYLLTDELLVIALQGALRGVHMGWEDMCKALNYAGHDFPPDVDPPV